MFSANVSALAITDKTVTFQYAAKMIKQTTYA